MGIIVFFPQFILSIISIIVINNQDFITKEDEENEYQNKTRQLDDIMDFVNYMLINSGNNIDNNNNTDGGFNATTDLTDSRISALKISPVINLAFYILTVLLTFLKVFKNF